jgi:protein-disulfide isomerase
MRLTLPAFLVLATAAFVAPTPALSQTAEQIAARTKGAANAPVTVYEMSDFQCPFCRRFATETFPTIEREFIATGKVKWIYVNLPLTDLHPNAVPAAQFALCAGRQNQFWPAHDLIFQHQATWAPLRNPAPFLLSLADTLRLNRAAATSCLQDDAIIEEIRQDAAGSQRAGAQSTPTFYIEGLLVRGAQPVGLFRHLLDSLHTVRMRR